MALIKIRRGYRWGRAPWRWRTRAHPDRFASFRSRYFAEVAADHRVVGVQAGGNFDLSAACIQIAVTDLWPDPGPALKEGIGLVELDGLCQRRLSGLCSLDLGQVGEA